MTTLSLQRSGAFEIAYAPSMQNDLCRIVADLQMAAG
jgi:hypothetical protein